MRACCRGLCLFTSPSVYRQLSSVVIIVYVSVYRSRCAYVLCIYILSAFRFKMEVAFVPRGDSVKCLICNQWLRCEQVFDHLRGSKHHNNRFHARAREAARIAEPFSLDAMD